MKEHGDPEWSSTVVSPVESSYAFGDRRLRLVRKQAVLVGSAQ